MFCTGYPKVLAFNLACPVWKKGLILASRVQNALPTSPVSSLQWLSFCVCVLGGGVRWYSLSFPATAHQTCAVKHGPPQQSPKRCDENQEQNGGKRPCSQVHHHPVLFLGNNQEKTQGAKEWFPWLSWSPLSILPCPQD